jgi:hypothetical protein
MTHGDDSVLLPVLFARPGLATVPVLRIALVPEGGGAPHQSVRRPLEWLDQACSPASTGVLAALLPRFRRVDHYTASYLYPPRDVNQFVDEFPEGCSHALALLLAFYALGGDHTLGRRVFREQLEGWSASTYPDKQGTLHPVAFTREKLAAVFEENAELERLGCAPVRRVLLAEADRPKVAQMAGVAANASGGPIELTAEQVGAAEAGDSAAPGERALMVHFAGTFAEALEQVFGAALVGRFHRAVRLRRVGRRCAIVLGVLAAVAAVLVAWALLSRPGELESVEVVGVTGIHALDDSARTIWRRDFGTRVYGLSTIRDGDGRLRIAVGLAGDGTLAGYLLLLDAAGHELWRFHPGRFSPYTGDRRLHYAVRHILVTDVLPHPGREVVACWVSQWYPSRACILSEDGELLRQLWHPGALGGALRLGDSSRLVLWGCNNVLCRTSLGDGSDEIHYAFFCVKAEDFGGQCPPRCVEDVPRTPVLWYKVLQPQGLSYERVSGEVNFGPSEADFEIWTQTGWVLYLDREGNLLEVSESLSTTGPRPELLDVLAEMPPGGGLGMQGRAAPPGQSGWGPPVEGEKE